MEKCSAGGPSSEGSTERWDTPFNRATNAYKKRPLDKPPTSAGRTSGFGLNMKVAEYYASDGKSSKRGRRKTTNDKDEVEELKKKLATLEKKVETEKTPVDPDELNRLVDARIRQIMPPGLAEGIAAWNAAGQKGPIHVPSIGGSNSSINLPDAVTPPAPFLLGTSTPPSAHQQAVPENDRPAAATGALVSTRAELEAVDKVTN